MRALAVAVVSVGLPGVALAQAPSNDDFDGAAAISAVPFDVRLDTRQATRAGDDPFWCQGV
jgi:hypothetical protein